jgi:activating signal cointegrator complex subunit 1
MARGRVFSRGYARGRGGRGAGSSQRAPLTHFLCLPLVNSSSKAELEASLQRFRRIVTTLNAPLNTVPKLPLEAIRNVESLHLTLGVMSLGDEKLQEAIKLLNGLDIHELYTSVAPSEIPSTSETAPALTISLRSLVSMHTPTDTSVLFADPHDPSERLRTFAENLHAKFRDAGFLIDENRPLKLHATVYNTVYVRNSGRNKPRIDAVRLLGECKDFYWANQIRIEKVTICKMGAVREFNAAGEIVSEKYEEVAALDLPS